MSSHSISLPAIEDLEPQLQKVLKPANPKALVMVAKGVAPLPPQVLVPAWCYLIHHQDAAIQAAALKSLKEYPANSVASVAKTEIPHWALYEIGKNFQENEEILEIVLLNARTPSDLFIEVSANCSEKVTQIIVNNQERIIDRPEIVIELEKNPRNLKSNTDRLRQFLRLAGIYVPGDQDLDEKLEEATEKSMEEQQQEIDEILDAEELNEEKQMNLTKYIASLSIGAKVKLALKGNKEARKMLIKDTNKTVATSVLKSPKINDNEIVFFSALKNVSDDVVRGISNNPQWTKNYNVKLNLINHPKTPLDKSMAFIKFLNLRDLTSLTRAKSIPAPLKKSAKELLKVKRR